MLSNRKPEPGSVLDLANNGDLDSAIFQLNTILEEQRTEADRFGGAQALIFRQDWLTPTRRKELRQALSLLQSLPDAPDVLYLRGAAYEHLGEYDEASAWYKRATDSSFRPRPMGLYTRCRKALKLSKERESFRSRVQKSWDAFSRQESDLRRQMVEAETTEQEEKVSHQISKLLGMAMPEVPWVWEPDTAPEIQLDPGQHKITALLQQYFVDHAPQAVQDTWYLHVGEPIPTDEDLEKLRKSGGRHAALDVRIQQSGDDLDLVAYHPSLDPHNPKTGAREEIHWHIVQNLGEEVYLSTFCWVYDRGMPPEGHTIKLGQLLPTLEAMGLVDRKDRNTTLYRRRYFHFIPKLPEPTAEHHWREDISLAFTMDPRLHQSYETGSTDVYPEPDLAGTGAVPGFAVFPLTKQIGNPPALMQTLLEALIQAMDGDVGLVLGYAIGLRFGYLDLLAWDLHPALDTVRDLLRSHSIPWACWHTFYIPSPTVPLY